jgi:23S rRNA pseudouridine2457 synthase
MTRVVLFNKPFRVMSQFRESADKITLSRFFYEPEIRVAGRRDFDYVGQLLLTGNGRLIQKITHPRFTLEKTYWAQVEGEPGEDALDQLRRGVMLKDGKTRPAKAKLIEEPAGLWPRDPPIRYRAAIPSNWLELKITEGRNRQVRRMTAAVNFPTLRLVRASVGEWTLGELQPGEWTAA